MVCHFSINLPIHRALLLFLLLSGMMRARTQQLKPDSLLNKDLISKLKRPYAGGKEKFKGIQVFNSSLPKISTAMIKGDIEKVLFDSFNNSRNAVAGMLQKSLKEPLKVNEVSTEVFSQACNLLLPEMKISIRSNFEFHSKWSLSSVPIEISYATQGWSYFPNSPDINRLTFRFEKDAYLATLKKKLSGTFDPKTLLESVANPFDKIIEQAKMDFSAELDRVNEKYRGLLQQQLNTLKGLQDIFNADLQTLQQRFVNKAYIEAVAQKQAALAQLQQQLNNGRTVELSEIRNLENEILQFKGTQDLVTVFSRHKQKWFQSGLLSRLKELKILKESALQSVLNAPSTITRMALQRLSLTGLQRLFLGMNRFDIGQSASTVTPLTFRHLIINGINTEFNANNKTLGLLLGKTSDINSLIDYAFQQRLFSNTGSVAAVRMGTGTGKRMNSQLSVSSFLQTLPGNPVQGIIAFNAESFRKVLVTTISNQLTVGEKGQVSFELSRSASQYNTGKSSSDSGSSGSNAISRLLPGNDFMANTALSFRYSDEYTDKGLAYHVSFNKTANGYINPGDGYFSAGTTELGMGMRKSLFKNKLLVSFRGSQRNYRYNEGHGTIWKNSQFTADIKWKMKKGQYVALRYQPLTMIRKNASGKVPVNTMNRLAIDASLAKRISRKIYYRNYLSIAAQQNNFTWTDGSTINNQSVNISSLQQVSFGNKVIYVNVNCNYANSVSQLMFLNSSLYAEAGHSYVLLKNISGSTGLIYHSAAGWYRQAGIRQSLSGQMGKRFSINVFADLKKNIKIIQPLWNDLIRADVSLRYSINNKH